MEIQMLMLLELGYLGYIYRTFFWLNCNI
uniref:Uncharacterized protein n=1 Tax=Arundo donax TaxID=35708 RepID=A0A0A9BSV4_ARUDO